MNDYKTQWDLKILYSSLEEVDVHIAKIKKAYRAFARKYNVSTMWLESEEGLLKALKDYDALLNLKPFNPEVYLWRLYDLDTTNKEIEGKLNKVSGEMTQILNQVLFFSLALSSLPKEIQKKYLKSALLAPFRYVLESIFKRAPYRLSEEAEKVMNLKSLTSYELWVKGVSAQVSNTTIRFKGKDTPINEVLNKLFELPTQKRRKIWKECLTSFSRIVDFAETEINAVVTDKKINDELRGYKKPYSATVLAYENDEKEVEALVDLVTSSFSISHTFYALKKDLLGLSDMLYVDRGAKIGTIRTTFDFNTQVDLLSKAFGSFGSEYEKILRDMLAQGHIDVFPKKGKRGGAYCVCGVPGFPVYVLLNNVDSFDSYQTFAHEMGHAIHGMLTQQFQPLRYQDMPTSTAEVASTFFENIAFDHVFKNLSEKEQVIALHDRLDASMATIFRQIALFNFEKDLHESIRTQGVLSKERITELLAHHMKSYLGPAVEVSSEDGLSFIYWSHIRSFFYVYTYAYGELISSALYARYKKDETYKEKIKHFLAAGGSKKPEEIFKDIDVNTKDPQFFRLGLKKIERDIVTLKKLAKKAGMLG